MSIFLHEWKRGWKSFLIWTLSLAAVVFMMVVIYPEFEEMMAGLDDLIAGMGAFGDAFGLELLSFSDPIAYYGLEVGNTLGIGGAMFAAILGIGMLAKEEGSHTAEFLLTLPATRFNIALQKFLAMLSQIVLFNLASFGAGVLAFAMIGENLDVPLMITYHLALLLMMLVIGILTFGLSGFLHNRSMGLGIGIALLFYILNIVSNLIEAAEVLRYGTPFAFAEASRVISEGVIEWPYVLTTFAFALLVLAVGTRYFTRKDIRI